MYFSRNSFMLEESNSSQSDDSSFSTSSDEIEPDCLMPPIPSDDILKQIVQQVENYFTYENLIKNEFILKNIRRNKQGYVNLTLVASLRKVKSITKFHPQPWRLISYAIGLFSNMLELNPDGTKVRRKEPLTPIDDKNKYNRTVLVVDLPQEKADDDIILQDFSKFGHIESVRIFDSKTNYPSHNKLFKNINRKSLNIDDKQTCAVEFNFKNDAEKCAQSIQLLKHHDPIWSHTQLLPCNNHDNNNNNNNDIC